MRRVIIESPFASQTLIPEGKTRCAQLASGFQCDCWTTIAHEDACGMIAREPCAWCAATKKRAEEADRNTRYLDACLRDSLRRGEAPFASHRMYTSALDDSKPEERELGIRAGFAWRSAADATVFYTDLGWSRGMRAGEEHARRATDSNWAAGRHAHLIEYRTLGPDWDKTR